MEKLNESDITFKANDNLNFTFSEALRLIDEKITLEKSNQFLKNPTSKKKQSELLDNFNILNELESAHSNSSQNNIHSLSNKFK